MKQFEKDRKRTMMQKKTDAKKQKAGDSRPPLPAELAPSPPPFPPEPPAEKKEKIGFMAVSISSPPPLPPSDASSLADSAPPPADNRPKISFSLSKPVRNLDSNSCCRNGIPRHVLFDVVPCGTSYLSCRHQVVGENLYNSRWEGQSPPHNCTIIREIKTAHMSVYSSSRKLANT